MHSSNSNKLLLWLLIPLLSIPIMTSCGESERRSKSSPNQESEGRELNYTHSLFFLKSSEADTLGTIQVEVAETEQERNNGLMDVNSLPENKGMLFVFNNQEPRSFWMANTPLSLDIIFVNNRGKIVRIHHQTQPFSDQQYVTKEPARYVVEVNGGYTINHDIKEGDFIALPEEFRASE